MSDPGAQFYICSQRCAPAHNRVANIVIVHILHNRSTIRCCNGRCTRAHEEQAGLSVRHVLQSHIFPQPVYMHVLGIKLASERQPLVSEQVLLQAVLRLIEDELLIRDGGAVQKRREPFNLAVDVLALNRFAHAFCCRGPRKCHAHEPLALWATYGSGEAEDLVVFLLREARTLSSGTALRDALRASP